MSSAWVTATSPITTFTGSATNVQWYSTGTSVNAYVTTNNLYTGSVQGGAVVVHKVDAPTRLVAGQTYDMPDGSKVIINHDGGFQIDDTHAKVLYRASRVRDFNPFLNASDLLEEYIAELAPLGVRQDEVLHLEIEHFIYWLVHRAAEHDHDDVPVEIPRLPSAQVLVRNRCSGCGRFIRRVCVRERIFVCAPECLQRQMRRLKL